MSFQLTEFIKPSTPAKIGAIIANSKVETFATFALVVFYFAINQITFLMAAKNKSYITYLEKNLALDIENAIDPPVAVSDLFFYLSQIFVWVYVFATYFYRNSNDFKFRMWSLVVFYFVVLFAFPCLGMQEVTYIPVLQNKYSNAFSVEAALLTLCVGYKFPNKSKYYYMLTITPVYNLIAIFMMRDYVLSQVFGVLFGVAATFVPLTFIKENAVPIPLASLPFISV